MPFSPPTSSLNYQTHARACKQYTNTQRRLDNAQFSSLAIVSDDKHTSSCSIDSVFIPCVLKANQVIVAVNWKSYSVWPQFKAFLLYDIGIFSVEVSNPLPLLALTYGLRSHFKNQTEGRVGRHALAS